VSTENQGISGGDCSNPWKNEMRGLLMVMAVVVELPFVPVVAAVAAVVVVVYIATSWSWKIKFVHFG